MMRTSLSALLLSVVLTSSSSEAFVLQPKQHSTTTTSTTQLAASALIVQNKGGGHGELGFQLAKCLQTKYGDKIDAITILQDDACNMSKEPFASYAADLPDVKIVQAPISGDKDMDAAAMQSALGGDNAQFDYVWDNASKGPEGAGKAICDLAAAWKSKLYTYVSSAGMYNPPPEGPFPMDEATTPTKESSGQAKQDAYAVGLGLPLVSFRPQYIYGPKASKYDYVDWYFDRLARELPLPIPGDGTQLVSLTNSEDVASILASPLNNEAAAIEQRYFNCGTSDLVSYNDVAYLCAEAAGIPVDDVKLEHYDADMFGKATFPFRMTDFYVAPDKVKSVLGWDGPAHKLKDDLAAWYYDSYVARGGPTKKMSLVKDWEIVVGSKTSLPEYVASIYEKYDPIVLDTSLVDGK